MFSSEKCLFRFFSPVFDWVVCFSGIELYELLVYFGNLFCVMEQEWLLHNGTGEAEGSYPTPKVRGGPIGATPCPSSRAAAERSYPMPKVRGSGREELLHIQGKQQWLCFAGGSCEETLNVQGKRNPSMTVGAERGNQRAERLKPQSDN